MSLYKHFTPEQRNQLSILLVAGLAQKEIAKLLNKTESAISQELKRNPAPTKTGITIYFAWPYHSWERGTNENCNGLLRQFFPKKSTFAMITQERIDEVCELINNRPRKRHNYKTPNEIFRQI
jgi:IS30 family transposase